MSNLTVMEEKQLVAGIPQITSGDTVKVYQKVKEGDKERVASFEGMIISVKHGRGISATFTVRKVVDGIGVEKTFPFHSPTIEKIEVVSRSKVRRSKLYYIREKAAREIRRKMKQTRIEAEQKTTETKEEETEPTSSETAENFKNTKET